jgi:hypothetical protein
MKLRDQAAAEIERLVAFLDATEGDIDLEPNLAGGSWDDREFDPADDRLHDHADDEPSLGAHSTDERSQEHWAQGGGDDREGYDYDMEPSLCGIGGHEFQPQPSATFRDLDLEANGGTT